MTTERAAFASGKSSDAKQQRREQAAKRRRRRRLGRRLEVIATGAIGLLALLVSAYTVYVQRQQLKAQAWPRLVLDGSSEPGATPGAVHFTLSVKNRGVAPAEVRAMSVLFNGQPVSDWGDLIDRAERERHVRLAFRADGRGTPAGVVLGAGDEIAIFKTESAAAVALLFVEDYATSMTLCYCSMLGDCWLLDVPAKGESTTTPVSTCPTPAVKFHGWREGDQKAWADDLLDAGRDGAPRDGEASER
jgi:hypothetical protein